MKVGRFNIIRTDVNEKVKTFLLDHYKNNLKRTLNDCLIVWNEHYHFRTNSKLMYSILMHKEEDLVKIEIVAGGGGVGFFNWSYGSENNTIKVVWKDISNFCELNKLKLTELSINEIKIETK